MPSTPQTVDPAEVLDQIAARADAATDGPWDTDGGTSVGIGDVWLAHVVHDPGRPVQARDDAEFIAASRTDVPRLVAALRAVLVEADAADESASHDSEQECGLVHTHRLRAAITSALGGAA